MIELKRAAIEDAETITEIKTKAYNKEIRTYLGRDGGPEGYSRVESQVYIIKTFLAYKIIRDTAIIGAFFLIPMSDAVMRFEDFAIAPESKTKGMDFKRYSLLKENTLTFGNGRYRRQPSASETNTCTKSLGIRKFREMKMK